MKRLQLLLVASLLWANNAPGAVITYASALSGSAESPANASPATGFTTVTIDTIANTLRVVASFTGLMSNDTAAHIHCCTVSPGTGNAGVATTTPTFAGFPTTVTSGTYDNTLDLTSAASYNPAFVTAEGGTVAGAEAALLAGMAANETYLNIHTTAFPGGEIRGYLVATPEPASLLLLAAGSLIGLARRRLSRR